MPVQNSPPANWTRSQARDQAVLSPTPRVPLDGTPAVPQLRAHLDRGPAPSSREGRGPIGAAKWIEPYRSNLTNQEPNYLPNSWNLFKSQLFTLFGDPNEVRKAEADLDSLRMQEVGHVSLYISDFRRLVSRIGDWGERALVHNFRKEFPSRILDQLAFHPLRIDSLQDLMDVTLKPDTRYHKRQKEKGHFQEKKSEASNSNSSLPHNSLSSNQKKKNFQKRDKLHSSFLNKYFKFMDSEKERRIKESLCYYCGVKHSLEFCFKICQTSLSSHKVKA
ncbi:hypothetical protein O181_032751 [Austropuccinia psidii MF-1]|uniref:Retrotransposon gag domain-containing protein n=1 Tax=Austropuccinia psidii MF-1 TaxID=1389203 RepID=A0A9Q3CXE5_9BASI|nr:hypothetical protein [Austropuccinia psidii MF-1]